MHATLSPSWKKSLLLVFVSVAAFATATPATSGPECFFQGLGFLPGTRNESSATGVSADGTVVVGAALMEPIPAQAFRWTAASGMVGLRFLPGDTRSFANGVNANGTVVVGNCSGPLFPLPLPVRVFHWDPGTMVGLGFLPRGNRSVATG